MPTLLEGRGVRFVEGRGVRFAIMDEPENINVIDKDKLMQITGGDKKSH